MPTGNIFSKMSLTPKQLRTVADRRFGDALALRDTHKNERANGAMYLGGFVIECLLKAKLLQEYPWLQNCSHPQGRSSRDQKIWSLCYRKHDLEEVLIHLPRLSKSLAKTNDPRLLQNLTGICAKWTIFARYSPQSAMMAEATVFLDRIKELKSCLT